MLKSLYVKNYILIDELEVDFDSGFNVITGETGAGKSILITAIDIALGAKTGKEVIKNGSDKAVIELTVLNKRHDLSKILDEFGIDNNGEEIVFSREISQTSSKSKINGCLVSQDCLKLLRELFVDIHTQHQTYSILQPKNHIRLLDSYIKSPALVEYNSEYAEYKKLLTDLEVFKNKLEKTEEQIDFIKFQVNEIESAEITSETEDEELTSELSVLENAEKLKELTGASYWALTGDDGSITEALYEIKSNLSKASGMDSKLRQTEAEITEVIDSIKGISSSLREYSSSMESDTGRIDKIQERLFTLDKLKRKYGGSLDKIIQTGAELRTELDNIEFSTQNVENLEKAIFDKKNILQDLAGKISEERRKYSKILSDKIVEKLEKLELPKVKFGISIESTELQSDGADKVEFLISTNVSEGLKPIAKAASGGEISRIMLAIKTIFAQADNIDTVIFDEIDTGISGKTSQSVAEEVRELSKYMQVVMITHQAIIAAKANKHFYIKKTQSDKTDINVYVLEGENKLMGIAELVSGNISDESMKLAESLVNN